MSWLSAAQGAIGGAWNRASSAVQNTARQATGAVSNWLGHAPNTADAPTARGGAPLHQDQPSSFLGRLGQNIGDLGRGLRQEGIGGLLDPAGVLDRQRAQRELSDRFQVMPDNFVGPRAQNQVSQAEYQQIARTFSNIRTGRGDLSIDGSGFSSNAGGDRRNWEQGIQSNIADMMMTRSGRSQIESLSNNVARKDDGTARRHLWGLGPEVHHQTTITPFFGEQTTDAAGRKQWTDPSADNRNASTLRYDNANATPQGDGATRVAAPTAEDPLHYERGTGTDSVVRINPGSILGLRSDVVMAHELQHALHQTQGTNAPRDSNFGTGPDANIRNSERQAVGLTRSDTATGGHYPGDADGCTENTYRQERNALGDRFLPRTQYSGSSLPGEAPATTTDEQLQQIWNNHNNGPNVPH